MSEYKQQEYDFVSRTKEIINQYNSFPIPINEKYETTLLINCMVGLLIVPQQYWFKKLPTEIISKEKWGFDKTNIKDNNKGYSIKEIAVHIRNCLAHYRYVIFSNEKKEISHIIIEDYIDNAKTNKTFEATISIDSLRTFADKLSSEFLKYMRTEKKINKKK